MLTFSATDIAGLFVVDTGAIADERGAFARLYCPRAFADAGIPFNSQQINLSSNTRRDTLRGMHFQRPPHDEAKLVRVLSGAIYDVVADIRPDSPTYRQWRAFELTRANRRALVVPSGCAHGFLTLADDCDVLYQMDRIYQPGHAQGFRFDDPAFAIEWPATPAVISQADLDWARFGE